MKNLLLILLSLFYLIILSPEIIAQSKKSYTKFKTKTYTNTYKIPKSNYNSTFKPKSYNSSYKKPDYTVGSKKYKICETHKSTGLPKVQRSSSAKNSLIKVSLPCRLVFPLYPKVWPGSGS